MNPDTIRARSMLTSAVRAFFSLKNYLEVETPILAPALIPEAAIEVFRTRFEHPWRGSQDMYLTPSPELWMKRLLAEGSGNIFQICKAFRNAESIGEQHNPEFTILEYYTVNADYMDSLKLTEDFFEYLCDYPRGGALAFPAGRGKGRGLEENCKRLRPPFRRMSMEEAFQTYARIDLASFAPRRAEQEPAAAKALTEEARGKGLPSKEGDSWEEAFNRIFAGAVEPLLPEDRPLVLLNYPRGVHCLARDIPESPWNERWELYAGGRETANCFTEESDPRRIAAYFQAEAAAKRGALVPHAIDEEFIGLYENARPASGCARDSGGAGSAHYNPYLSESGRLRAHCSGKPTGPSAGRGLGAESPVPAPGRNAPISSSVSSSGVALGLDRLFMTILGESSIGGVILFPFSDILRQPE